MELGAIIFIDDARLESTFDIDELALDEELLSPLGEWTPDDTIGIFSFRKWFPSWSLVVTIGCDRECCNFFVSGSSLYEGILRDISDQDNLIDGSHREENKEK